MKIYLVCESYCYGCFGHGWSIKKCFLAEDAATDFCNKLEEENYDTDIEYYIDTVEVH